MKVNKLIQLIIVIMFAALLYACASNDNNSESTANTPVSIDETKTEAAEMTVTSSASSDIEPVFDVNNKVMRVVTGGNQWEGIRISGKNLKLEMGKSYEFSFRAYTPSVRNGGVGIIFQANTNNGWNWDKVADMTADNFLPAGWREITGTLDLTADRPKATGLPTLVFAKLGDGGVYDSQTATFYIDDFIVTETITGETVFSDDFQGAKTLFEDNGGSLSLVSESVIYEAAQRETKGEYALNVPSLKEIYADYFLIGNIINPVNLSGNAEEQEFYAVLKYHYNALTFENDMKPDAMWGDIKGSYERPPVPTARLAQMDGWIKKLIGDGFEIIGHNLVWHNQSPNWLNLAAGERNKNTAVYKTYAEARENLKLFISNIAGHYYNNPDGLKIRSWDVINEAIRKNDKYKADEANWGYHTMGAIWPPTWDSPWYRAYANEAPEGVNPWDYVYDSFYFARTADPSAELYYNDYGMEDPTKVKLVVNMVNAVNLKWAQSEDNPQGKTEFADVREYIDAGGRLLIEGIGMQEHDTIGNNSFFGKVEKAIQAYISTGAKISITELDVGVPNYKRGETLSPEDELKQALHYARLFEIFKRYSDNIERVSFWGVYDARSWRADDLCLIFDADLHTKLAYYAVADPEGFIAKYAP